LECGDSSTLLAALATGRQSRAAFSGRAKKVGSHFDATATSRLPKGADKSAHSKPVVAASAGLGPSVVSFLPFKWTHNGQAVFLMRFPGLRLHWVE
jgi:hypothetical protein